MSAEHHLEVERKYTVDDAAEPPDLTRLAGVVTVVRHEPVDLEAVYFDTDDRALFRARIALRRRRGGPDAGWHLKSPGSGGRVEVHDRIDDAEPDTPPAALLDEVRSRVRGRPLQPIARIATVRSAVRLSDVDGERIELVDDRVRATDIDSGEVRVWREWEAEQIGDDADRSAALLDVLEAVLLQAGARLSSSPAKLAQALGGVPDEDAEAIDPTAGAAVARLLRRRIERLHRDEAALRHGGPEAVHTLRKTLRRLRALLGLTAITGTEGRALRRRLGVAGTLLGEARDPVVGADLLERFLADDPDLPGSAGLRERMVDGARAEAEARRRRAVAVLAADEHLRLIDDLERFAATSLPGSRADEPVGAVLPRLARKAARRAANRATRRADRPEHLHAVRKASRRARFVLEALEEAGFEPDRGSRRISRAARHLQDRLGTHRDHLLLAAELPFDAERAAAQGDSGFADGVLAERIERAAEAWLSHSARTRVQLQKAVRRSDGTR